MGSNSRPKLVCVMSSRVYCYRVVYIDVESRCGHCGARIWFRIGFGNHLMCSRVSIGLELVLGFDIVAVKWFSFGFVS